MDMLVMANVVENACREDHVESTVWDGNAIILNLQARSYPGETPFCYLQTALRNVGTGQLSGGEILAEVWRRIAHARPEIQNVLWSNFALPCQQGECLYLVLMEIFRTFSGHSHASPKQLVVLVGEAIEFGRIHGTTLVISSAE
jgi:hypothetical protein